MEKDDEAKGVGNAYDFGGRSLYDGRLARFISVDPDERMYPFMSPYCYAANMPISHIDYDGRGPLAIALRIFLAEEMAVTNALNISAELKLDLSESVGASAFFGFGAAKSASLIIDPQGNIAFAFSGGTFVDIGSFMGGYADGGGAYGTPMKGVEDGNFVLGAQVSLMANLVFHNKQSVLDFSGMSKGSAGVPVNIRAGELLGGGLVAGEESLGISFGLAFGAAISVIGSETFVYATNIDDIEKAENNFYYALFDAWWNDGDLGYSLEYSKDGDKLVLSYTVTTTDDSGNEIVESYEAMVLIIDGENLRIYSEGVQKIEEDEGN